MEIFPSFHISNSRLITDFYFFIIFQDNKDSGGIPVTLRVDAKGFFLYWIDQNHEMDLLDIATVRDVRTGQYAKKPKVRNFIYYILSFT